jgi:hypothetical protein
MIAGVFEEGEWGREGERGRGKGKGGRGKGKGERGFKEIVGVDFVD